MATSVEESMANLKGMATEDFLKEIAALIKSRCTLTYLVSTEEKRVIEYFRNYTIAGNYRTHVWDCFNGLVKIKSMEKAGLITENDTHPHSVLDHIIKEAAQQESVAAAKRQAKEKGDKKDVSSDYEEDDKAKDEGTPKGNIYILLDFHRFLEPVPDPDTERRLRTLARMSSNTCVILVGPHYTASPALEKDIRVIDFPYPNKEEIKKSLYRVTAGVSSKIPGLKNRIKEREEEIVNSVGGLTDPELCAAFAKSVCMHKDLHIPTILKEKQEVIRKTGILEFFTPKIGINDIGGLGNLVDFLKLRKSCFTQEAADFGLTAPKGILLVGVPGAGKSLAAKATASLFEMPLLRLDFGALFASHVGDSEKNVRVALKMAEQLAPCVLWIDEIEKGLSGYRSSGATDSGVTSRVISTLLTWMQEKTAAVFLMCTANQHEAIPAEFMRAGRFDEIFFVDVPTGGERAVITEKLLIRKKRNPKKFDLEEIAGRSQGYTGAELEKAIDMGLLTAYQDGRRELKTSDITEALGKFKPLSVMRPEVIETLRVWAEGRCLKANTPDATPGSVVNGVADLDVDD